MLRFTLPFGSRRSHLRARVAGFSLAFTAIVALGVAFASQPISAKTSKPRINVLWVGTINSPVLSQADELAGVQAAALTINRAGGINGQPVHIIACDDMFTASGAATCAHQGVNDHAMVSVYDGGFQATVQPILESAGIPTFGQTDVPFTKPQPLFFNILPSMGADVQGAGVVQLKNAGVKKLALVVLPVAQALLNAQATASVAKKIGLTVTTTVQVPATTVDYSSIVEAVQNSGAQGVEMVLTPTQILSFLQTAHQLDPNLRFTGVNQYQTSQWKTLASSVSGKLYLPNAVPPPTAVKQYPSLKTYKGSIEAAANAGISGVQPKSGSGETYWYITEALAAALKQSKKPITSAKQLVNVIRSSKPVSIGGFATWNVKAKGPSYEPYSSNGDVFSDVLRGQNLYLTKPAIINMHKVQ